MTSGVLRGLMTLRRYILITRGLADHPQRAIDIELANDADGAYLAGRCTGCDREWDRLTCGASWATVMAIVGHFCGDLMLSPCPDCGASSPPGRTLVIRTDRDGWICTACGSGRDVT